MQSRLTSERNSCINKKRLRGDKSVGNVIIFVTTGTQEEKWFQSMTEDLKADFIYCKSVKDVLSKL